MNEKTYHLAKEVKEQNEEGTFNHIRKSNCKNLFTSQLLYNLVDAYKPILCRFPFKQKGKKDSSM